MKIKVPYLTPHQYPSPKPQEEVALELERSGQVFTVCPQILPLPTSLSQTNVLYPQSFTSKPHHLAMQILYMDAILAQKAQSTPSNLKSLPGCPQPLENSEIPPTTYVHRNCI